MPACRKKTQRKTIKTMIEWNTARSREIGSYGLGRKEPEPR